jgi:hypothetical protein
MTSASEILVIDPNPDRPPSRPVVSSAGPRVLVVRAEPGELDQLVDGARFAMARHADGRIEERGDGSVLGELDVGARLFVDGWRARADDKPDRPGDGLSWDSPGFEPPDRPPA